MCDGPKIALKVWPEFGTSIGVGRRKAYEIAREIGVRVDGRLIVPVTSIEAWLDRLNNQDGVMVDDDDQIIDADAIEVLEVAEESEREILLKLVETARGAT